MRKFNYRTIEAGIKVGFKGRLKVQVVEAGRIVEDRPWQNNLILDLGLNEWAARETANLFTHAVAGTGNTPTSDDSGAVTASQSGTTVTASASFFDEDSVGKLIKWDSGEETRITGFTNDTTVTVADSQTVASDEFTLYRVNQTGLDTESKRSNTYLTGSSNCNTTVVGSVVTMKRTYDFSAESGSVNYAEVGFSWTATAGGNLFSRILLSGGAVTVLSGQQLRLVYELALTCSPTSAEAIDAAITGWPISPATTTEGDQAWQQLGLRVVDTLGASVSWGSGPGTGGSGAGDCNEPSKSSSINSRLGIFISPSSAALGTFATSSSDRSTNAAYKEATTDAYVTGSFERVRQATFSTSEANRTDFRSIGMFAETSLNGPDASSIGFALLFDEAQTKANTHTLKLRFKYTWDRTIS